MSANKTPSTPTTERLAIDNVNIDRDAELAVYDNQVIADGNKILQREPPRSPG
jgi:hypothetical protein